MFLAPCFSIVCWACFSISLRFELGDKGIIFTIIAAMLVMSCFYERRFINFELFNNYMNKETLKLLQIIVWILGFIALGLLIWGIIRALS